MAPPAATEVMASNELPPKGGRATATIHAVAAGGRLRQALAECRPA
jgi:hypothetical protein